MPKMGLEDSVPTNRETSASLEVILTDSWAEEDFTLGDTIQIVPGVGLSIHGRQITISDSPGLSKSEQGLENHIPALLIQYPDFLVPCTKLVGSLYCTRRSVIEQFWPAGDSAPESVSVAKDGSNQTHPGFVMLLGSLLHELFQQLINLRHPTVEDGKAFVQSMVTRADFILQAYVCGTKVADLRMVLFEKIKTILNWIEVHRRIDLTPRSSTVRKPVVHEVLDIEENIWSTRFGLKGKIDLSALCAAPTSSFGKTQTVPSDDSIVLSLVPIELKTGRPTYSVEHKGQVLLYLLMLFDRYGSHYKFARKKNVQTARFGWLVYLQDPQSSVTAASDPGLIEPKMSEFRGLIQTRNRIAAHLMRVTGANLDSPHQGTSSSLPWKPELPEPTKRLHTCKMCPVQLACSLLSARNDSIHNDCSSKSATMITEITSVSELLTTKRTHLTTDHVSFFLRWSRLILLELADTDRLENVVRQIVIGHRWKKSTDHETRLTVRALRAIHGMKNPANGQWITLFTSCTPDVESPSQPGDFDPAPGDFVIVSSHDRNNVGVALGTILSPEEITDTHISSRPEFRNSRNPILLSTDGPLPKWIDSFRLDRYVTSKGTQLNLSNMVNLMEDSELSAYLRRLIVNRNEPTFSSTLSKRTVQDIRTFLKPMNMDQRAAILRVLMANDYVLIQGYPGTGKTQTLTALLKVLILLGRKTLVVAHTHSAVDNLLGRLIQSGEKRVLRLGSADRIRPDLLDFCFEKILTNSSSNSDTEDAVDRCQRLIDEAVVVGCSALAASGGQGARHAALCRIQFDTVVIDEATQLLLPTAIGSLFCLRPKPTVPGARFVLVGDPYQLPPLVQSSRARHAGYECSLFSHLLNRKDSCPLDSRTSNVVLSDSSTVSSLAKNPALVELTLQYRMNRRILLLSNQLTYSHAIRSANTKISEASLADVLRPNDSEMTHSWTKRVYSTDVTDSVIFLDTHLWNCCSPHSKSGTHFQNRTEAGLVVWILSGFFRFELKAADVGVIAPHRKQVALIRELLANSPSRPDESRLVEVNTVDQFQGRDKRLIVLSLTTCSGATVSDGSFDQNQRSTTGRLGLLDSLPRLTVALTRAKHKLLLIGCPGTCDAFAPKHATESVRDSDKRSLDKLFTLLERISATETLPVASRTILDT
ncbi:DNA replication ATP-dependent helicase/nuclease DNA2 [Fasciola hepatica]|uniref:DNA replication ATP-dependent helicase/nuclease n=1 Tax=Fasciola hepatica TaxID=6192 RepID=A0A4E0RQ95_FASHE|nr:DNA replication ATP-dependent helicase/nuclease DNA2 [Fasciola hepatica]